MGIQRGLIAALVLALVFAGTALADEPMSDAPPAGVALPEGDVPQPPPPPPPPPGDTIIVVPQRPVYEQPIYPTDQPRDRTYDPYAPSVQDFDRATGAVRQRTGPCAPRMNPMPIPCDPCDPCPPCPKPQFDCYGGFNLSAYPGIGFGVEFGMWFARSNCVDWAGELNLNYQDLTEDFNNIHSGEGGKWVNARLGVKASFMPRGNSHPVLRAGLGWGVESGDAGEDYDIGDIPENPGQTNFFGGYVGAGWEWDLFNGRVTTGPEVWAFAGYPEKGSDWAWTATFAWHVLFNF